MVAALVRAEVAGIVEAIRASRGGVTIAGFGEMPHTVLISLGKWAIATLTEDGTAAELLARWRVVVCTAFLAGRMFGRLEASTALKNIVNVVPMAETSAPSLEYEMHGDDEEPEEEDQVEDDREQ